MALSEGALGVHSPGVSAYEKDAEDLDCVKGTYRVHSGALVAKCSP
jgi:hypothetical protein